MKDSLKVGSTITKRYDVTKDNTIGFMGEDLRVYSTPSMVMNIEQTCRDLMVQHADEGEDSVGARVEIDHLGPTLNGMWVEVTATVVEIEGPRVIFEAEVHDALDKVGQCRHVRFAVETGRQKGRLEKKAARLKEAG